VVDRGNALPEEADEPRTGEIGRRLRAIGTAYTALQVVPTEAAAGSNAQRFNNPFVERLVGSIRRECLDHVVVWDERALRYHLRRYLIYYHQWRTHLSLGKDAPIARAIQSPSDGSIVAVPHVGGLHHHYERRAA